MYCIIKTPVNNLFLYSLVLAPHLPFHFTDKIVSEGKFSSVFPGKSKDLFIFADAIWVYFKIRKNGLPG